MANPQGTRIGNFVLTREDKRAVLIVVVVFVFLWAMLRGCNYLADLEYQQHLEEERKRELADNEMRYRAIDEARQRESEGNRWKAERHSVEEILGAEYVPSMKYEYIFEACFGGFRENYTKTEKLALIDALLSERKQYLDSLREGHRKGGPPIVIGFSYPLMIVDTVRFIKEWETLRMKIVYQG